MLFRGLIQSPVARKNAHYPIFILFSYVLFYLLESKKSGKKKSLNTFSLAANILKPQIPMRSDTIIRILDRDLIRTDTLRCVLVRVSRTDTMCCDRLRLLA